MRWLILLLSDPGSSFTPTLGHRFHLDGGHCVLLVGWRGCVHRLYQVVDILLEEVLRPWRCELPGRFVRHAGDA